MRPGRAQDGHRETGIAVEVIHSTEAIDFEAWGRRLVDYAVDLHRERVAASSPARRTTPSPAA